MNDNTTTYNDLMPQIDHPNHSHTTMGQDHDEILPPVTQATDTQFTPFYYLVHQFIDRFIKHGSRAHQPGHGQVAMMISFCSRIIIRFSRENGVVFFPLTRDNPSLVSEYALSPHPSLDFPHPTLLNGVMQWDALIYHVIYTAITNTHHSAPPHPLSSRLFRDGYLLHHHAQHIFRQSISLHVQHEEYGPLMRKSYLCPPLDRLSSMHDIRKRSMDDLPVMASYLYVCPSDVMARYLFLNLKGRSQECLLSYVMGFPQPLLSAFNSHESSHPDDIEPFVAPLILNDTSDPPSHQFVEKHRSWQADLSAVSASRPPRACKVYRPVILFCLVSVQKLNDILAVDAKRGDAVKAHRDKFDVEFLNTKRSPVPVLTSNAAEKTRIRRLKSIAQEFAAFAPFIPFLRHFSSIIIHDFTSLQLFPAQHVLSDLYTLPSQHPKARHDDALSGLMSKVHQAMISPPNSSSPQQLQTTPLPTHHPGRPAPSSATPPSNASDTTPTTSAIAIPTHLQHFLPSAYSGMASSIFHGIYHSTVFLVEYFKVTHDIMLLYTSNELQSLFSSFLSLYNVFFPGHTLTTLSSSTHSASSSLCPRYLAYTHLFVESITECGLTTDPFSILGRFTISGLILYLQQLRLVFVAMPQCKTVFSQLFATYLASDALQKTDPNASIQLQLDHHIVQGIEGVGTSQIYRWLDELTFPVNISPPLTPSDAHDGDHPQKHTGTTPSGLGLLPIESMVLKRELSIHTINSHILILMGLRRLKFYIFPSSDLPIELLDSTDNSALSDELRYRLTMFPCPFSQTCDLLAAYFIHHHGDTFTQCVNSLLRSSSSPLSSSSLSSSSILTSGGAGSTLPTGSPADLLPSPPVIPPQKNAIQLLSSASLSQRCYIIGALLFHLQTSTTPTSSPGRSNANPSSSHILPTLPRADPVLHTLLELQGRDSNLESLSSSPPTVPTTTTTAASAIAPHSNPKSSLTGPNDMNPLLPVNVNPAYACFVPILNTIVDASLPRVLYTMDSPFLSLLTLNDSSSPKPHCVPFSYAMALQPSVQLQSSLLRYLSNVVSGLRLTAQLEPSTTSNSTAMHNDYPGEYLSNLLQLYHLLHAYHHSPSALISHVGNSSKHGSMSDGAGASSTSRFSDSSNAAVTAFGSGTTGASHRDASTVPASSPLPFKTYSQLIEPMVQVIPYFRDSIAVVHKPVSDGSGGGGGCSDGANSNRDSNMMISAQTPDFNTLFSYPTHQRPWFTTHHDYQLIRFLTAKAKGFTESRYRFHVNMFICRSVLFLALLLNWSSLAFQLDHSRRACSIQHIPSISTATSACSGSGSDIPVDGSVPPQPQSQSQSHPQQASRPVSLSLVIHLFTIGVRVLHRVFHAAHTHQRSHHRRQRASSVSSISSTTSSHHRSPSTIDSEYLESTFPEVVSDILSSIFQPNANPSLHDDLLSVISVVVSSNQFIFQSQVLSPPLPPSVLSGAENPSHVTLSSSIASHLLSLLLSTEHVLREIPVGTNVLQHLQAGISSHTPHATTLIQSLIHSKFPDPTPNSVSERYIETMLNTFFPVLSTAVPHASELWQSWGGSPCLVPSTSQQTDLKMVPLSELLSIKDKTLTAPRGVIITSSIEESRSIQHLIEHLPCSCSHAGDGDGSHIANHNAEQIQLASSLIGKTHLYLHTTMASGCLAAHSLASSVSTDALSSSGDAPQTELCDHCVVRSYFTSKAYLPPTRQPEVSVLSLTSSIKRATPSALPTSSYPAAPPPPPTTQSQHGLSRLQGLSIHNADTTQLITSMDDPMPHIIDYRGKESDSRRINVMIPGDSRVGVPSTTASPPTGTVSTVSPVTGSASNSTALGSSLVVDHPTSCPTLQSSMGMTDGDDDGGDDSNTLSSPTPAPSSAVSTEDTDFTNIYHEYMTHGAVNLLCLPASTTLHTGLVVSQGMGLQDHQVVNQAHLSSLLSTPPHPLQGGLAADFVLVYNPDGHPLVPPNPTTQGTDAQHIEKLNREMISLSSPSGVSLSPSSSPEAASVDLSSHPSMDTDTPVGSILATLSFPRFFRLISQSYTLATTYETYALRLGAPLVLLSPLSFTAWPTHLESTESPMALPGAVVEALQSPSYIKQLLQTLQRAHLPLSLPSLTMLYVSFRSVTMEMGLQEDQADAGPVHGNTRSTLHETTLQAVGREDTAGLISPPYQEQSTSDVSPKGPTSEDSPPSMLLTSLGRLHRGAEGDDPIASMQCVIYDLARNVFTSSNDDAMLCSGDGEDHSTPSSSTSTSLSPFSLSSSNTDTPCNVPLTIKRHTLITASFFYPYLLTPIPAVWTKLSSTATTPVIYSLLLYQMKMFTKEQTLLRFHSTSKRPVVVYTPPPSSQLPTSTSTSTSTSPTPPLLSSQPQGDHVYSCLGYQTIILHSPPPKKAQQRVVYRGIDIQANNPSSPSSPQGFYGGPSRTPTISSFETSTYQLYHFSNKVSTAYASVSECRQVLERFYQQAILHLSRLDKLLTSISKKFEEAITALVTHNNPSLLQMLPIPYPRALSYIIFLLRLRSSPNPLLQSILARPLTPQNVDDFEPLVVSTMLHQVPDASTGSDQPDQPDQLDPTAVTAYFQSHIVFPALFGLVPDHLDYLHHIATMDNKMGYDFTTIQSNLSSHGGASHSAQSHGSATGGANYHYFPLPTHHASRLYSSFVPLEFTQGFVPPTPLPQPLTEYEQVIPIPSPVYACDFHHQQPLPSPSPSPAHHGQQHHPPHQQPPSPADLPHYHYNIERVDIKTSAASLSTRQYCYTLPLWMCTGPLIKADPLVAELPAYTFSNLSEHQRTSMDESQYLSMLYTIQQLVELNLIGPDLQPYTDADLKLLDFSKFYQSIQLVKPKLVGYQSDENFLLRVQNTLSRLSVSHHCDPITSMVRGCPHQKPTLTQIDLTLDDDDGGGDHGDHVASPRRPALTHALPFLPTASHRDHTCVYCQYLIPTKATQLVFDPMLGSLFDELVNCDAISPSTLVSDDLNAYPNLLWELFELQSQRGVKALAYLASYLHKYLCLKCPGCQSISSFGHQVGRHQFYHEYQWLQTYLHDHPETYSSDPTTRQHQPQQPPPTQSLPAASPPLVNDPSKLPPAGLTLAPPSKPLPSFLRPRQPYQPALPPKQPQQPQQPQQSQQQQQQHQQSQPPSQLNLPPPPPPPPPSVTASTHASGHHVPPAHSSLKQSVAPQPPLPQLPDLPSPSPSPSPSLPPPPPPLPSQPPPPPQPRPQHSQSTFNRPPHLSNFSTLPFSQPPHLRQPSKQQQHSHSPPPPHVTTSTALATSPPSQTPFHTYQSHSTTQSPPTSMVSSPSSKPSFRWVSPQTIQVGPQFIRTPGHHVYEHIPSVYTFLSMCFAADKFTTMSPNQLKAHITKFYLMRQHVIDIHNIYQSQLMHITTVAPILGYFESDVFSSAVLSILPKQQLRWRDLALPETFSPSSLPSSLQINHTPSPPRPTHAAPTTSIHDIFYAITPFLSLSTELQRSAFDVESLWVLIGSLQEERKLDMFQMNQLANRSTLMYQEKAVIESAEVIKPGPPLNRPNLPTAKRFQQYTVDSMTELFNGMSTVFSVVSNPTGLYRPVTTSPFLQYMDNGYTKMYHVPKWGNMLKLANLAPLCSINTAIESDPDISTHHAMAMSLPVYTSRTHATLLPISIALTYQPLGHRYGISRSHLSSIIDLSPVPNLNTFWELYYRPVDATMDYHEAFQFTDLTTLLAMHTPSSSVGSSSSSSSSSSLLPPSRSVHFNSNINDDDDGDGDLDDCTGPNQADRDLVGIIRALQWVAKVVSALEQSFGCSSQPTTATTTTTITHPTTTATMTAMTTMTTVTNNDSDLYLSLPFNMSFYRQLYLAINTYKTITQAIHRMAALFPRYTTLMHNFVQSLMVFALDAVSDDRFSTHAVPMTAPFSDPHFITQSASPSMLSPYLACGERFPLYNVPTTYDIPSPIPSQTMHRSDGWLYAFEPQTFILSKPQSHFFESLLALTYSLSMQNRFPQFTIPRQLAYHRSVVIGYTASLRIITSLSRRTLASQVMAGIGAGMHTTSAAPQTTQQRGSDHGTQLTVLDTIRRFGAIYVNDTLFSPRNIAILLFYFLSRCRGDGNAGADEMGSSSPFSTSSPDSLLDYLEALSHSIPLTFFSYDPHTYDSHYHHNPLSSDAAPATAHPPTHTYPRFLLFMIQCTLSSAMILNPMRRHPSSSSSSSSPPPSSRHPHIADIPVSLVRLSAALTQMVQTPHVQLVTILRTLTPMLSLHQTPTSPAQDISAAIEMQYFPWLATEQPVPVPSSSDTPTIAGVTHKALPCYPVSVQTPSPPNLLQYPRLISILSKFVLTLNLMHTNSRTRIPFPITLPLTSIFMFTGVYPPELWSQLSSFGSMLRTTYRSHLRLPGGAVEVTQDTPLDYRAIITHNVDRLIDPLFWLDMAYFILIRAFDENHYYFECQQHQHMRALQTGDVVAHLSPQGPPPVKYQTSTYVSACYPYQLSGLSDGLIIHLKGWTSKDQQLHISLPYWDQLGLSSYYLPTPSPMVHHDVSVHADPHVNTSAFYCDPSQLQGGGGPDITSTLYRLMFDTTIPNYSSLYSHRLCGSKHSGTPTLPVLLQTAISLCTLTLHHLKQSYPPHFSPSVYSHVDPSPMDDQDSIPYFPSKKHRMGDDSPLHDNDDDDDLIVISPPKSRSQNKQSQHPFLTRDGESCSDDDTTHCMQENMMDWLSSAVLAPTLDNAKQAEEVLSPIWHHYYITIVTWPSLKTGHHYDPAMQLEQHELTPAAMSQMDSLLEMADGDGLHADEMTLEVLSSGIGIGNGNDNDTMHGDDDDVGNTGDSNSVTENGCGTTTLTTKDPSVIPLSDANAFKFVQQRHEQLELVNSQYVMDSIISQVSVGMDQGEPRGVACANGSDTTSTTGSSPLSPSPSSTPCDGVGNPPDPTPATDRSDPNDLKRPRFSLKDYFFRQHLKQMGAPQEVHTPLHFEPRVLTLSLTFTTPFSLSSAVLNSPLRYNTHVDIYLTPAFIVSPSLSPSSPPSRSDGYDSCPSSTYLHSTHSLTCIPYVTDMIHQQRSLLDDIKAIHPYVHPYHHGTTASTSHSPLQSRARPSFLPTPNLDLFAAATEYFSRLSSISQSSSSPFCFTSIFNAVDFHVSQTQSGKTSSSSSSSSSSSQSKQAQESTHSPMGKQLTRFDHAYSIHRYPLLQQVLENDAQTAVFPYHLYLDRAARLKASHCQPNPSVSKDTIDTNITVNGHYSHIPPTASPQPHHQQPSIDPANPSSLSLKSYLCLPLTHVPSYLDVFMAMESYNTILSQSTYVNVDPNYTFHDENAVMGQTGHRKAPKAPPPVPMDCCVEIHSLASGQLYLQPVAVSVPQSVFEHYMNHSQHPSSESTSSHPSHHSHTSLLSTPNAYIQRPQYEVVTAKMTCKNICKCIRQTIRRGDSPLVDWMYLWDVAHAPIVSPYSYHDLFTHAPITSSTSSPSSSTPSLPSTTSTMDGQHPLMPTTDLPSPPLLPTLSPSTSTSTSTGTTSTPPIHHGKLPIRSLDSPIILFNSNRPFFMDPNHLGTVSTSTLEFKGSCRTEQHHLPSAYSSIEKIAQAVLNYTVVPQQFEHVRAKTARNFFTPKADPLEVPLLLPSQDVCMELISYGKCSPKPPEGETKPVYHPPITDHSQLSTTWVYPSTRSCYVRLPAMLDFTVDDPFFQYCPYHYTPVIHRSLTRATNLAKVAINRYYHVTPPTADASTTTATMDDHLSPTTKPKHEKLPDPEKVMITTRTRYHFHPHCIWCLCSSVGPLQLRMFSHTQGGRGVIDAEWSLRSFYTLRSLRNWKVFLFSRIINALWILFYDLQTSFLAMMPKQRIPLGACSVKVDLLSNNVVVDTVLDGDGGMHMDDGDDIRDTITDEVTHINSTTTYPDGMSSPSSLSPSPSDESINAMEVTGTKILPNPLRYLVAILNSSVSIRRAFHHHLYSLFLDPGVYDDQGSMVDGGMGQSSSSLSATATSSSPSSPQQHQQQHEEQQQQQQDIVPTDLSFTVHGGFATPQPESDHLFTSLRNHPLMDTTSSYFTGRINHFITKLTTSRIDQDRVLSTSAFVDDDDLDHSMCVSGDDDHNDDESYGDFFSYLPTSFSYLPHNSNPFSARKIRDIVPPTESPYVSMLVDNCLIHPHPYSYVAMNAQEVPWIASSETLSTVVASKRKPHAAGSGVSSTPIAGHETHSSYPHHPQLNATSTSIFNRLSKLPPSLNASLLQAVEITLQQRNSQQVETSVRELSRNKTHKEINLVLLHTLLSNLLKVYRTAGDDLLLHTQAMNTSTLLVASQLLNRYLLMQHTIPYIPSHVTSYTSCLLGLELVNRDNSYTFRDIDESIHSYATLRPTVDYYDSHRKHRGVSKKHAHLQILDSTLIFPFIATQLNIEKAYRPEGEPPLEHDLDTSPPPSDRSFWTVYSKPSVAPKRVNFYPWDGIQQHMESRSGTQVSQPMSNDAMNASGGSGGGVTNSSHDKDKVPIINVYLIDNMAFHERDINVDYEPPYLYHQLHYLQTAHKLIDDRWWYSQQQARKINSVRLADRTSPDEPIEPYMQDLRGHTPPSQHLIQPHAHHLSPSPTPAHPQTAAKVDIMPPPASTWNLRSKPSIISAQTSSPMNCRGMDVFSMSFVSLSLYEMESCLRAVELGERANSYVLSDEEYARSVIAPQDQWVRIDSTEPSTFNQPFNAFPEQVKRHSSRTLTQRLVFPHSLLYSAVTPTSCSKHVPFYSYEQLEVVGDIFLKLQTVTSLLYSWQVNKTEGEVTSIKDFIVNNKTLFFVGQGLLSTCVRAFSYFNQLAYCFLTPYETMDYKKYIHHIHSTLPYSNLRRFNDTIQHINTHDRYPILPKARITAPPNSGKPSQQQQQQLYRNGAGHGATTTGTDESPTDPLHTILDTVHTTMLCSNRVHHHHHYYTSRSSTLQDMTFGFSDDSDGVNRWPVLCDLSATKTSNSTSHNMHFGYTDGAQPHLYYFDYGSSHSLSQHLAHIPTTELLAFTQYQSLNHRQPSLLTTKATVDAVQSDTALFPSISLNDKTRSSSTTATSSTNTPTGSVNTPTPHDPAQGPLNARCTFQLQPLMTPSMYPYVVPQPLDRDSLFYIQPPGLVGMSSPPPPPRIPHITSSATTLHGETAPNTHCETDLPPYPQLQDINNELVIGYLDTPLVVGEYGSLKSPGLFNHRQSMDHAYGLINSVSQYATAIQEFDELSAIRHPHPPVDPSASIEPEFIYADEAFQTSYQENVISRKTKLLKDKKTYHQNGRAYGFDLSHIQWIPPGVVPCPMLHMLTHQRIKTNSIQLDPYEHHKRFTPAPLRTLTTHLIREVKLSQPMEALFKSAKVYRLLLQINAKRIARCGHTTNTSTLSDDSSPYSNYTPPSRHYRYVSQLFAIQPIAHDEIVCHYAKAPAKIAEQFSKSIPNNIASYFNATSFVAGYSIHQLIPSLLHGVSYAQQKLGSQFKEGADHVESFIGCGLVTNQTVALARRLGYDFKIPNFDHQPCDRHRLMRREMLQELDVKQQHLRTEQLEKHHLLSLSRPNDPHAPSPLYKPQVGPIFCCGCGYYAFSQVDCKCTQLMKKINARAVGESPTTPWDGLALAPYLFRYSMNGYFLFKEGYQQSSSLTPPSSPLQGSHPQHSALSLATPSSLLSPQQSPSPYRFNQLMSQRLFRRSPSNPHPNLRFPLLNPFRPDSNTIHTVKVPMYDFSSLQPTYNQREDETSHNTTSTQHAIPIPHRLRAIAHSDCLRPFLTDNFYLELINEQQLSDIQKALNYTFNHPALLVMAFIHQSSRNIDRHHITVDYQALELIGDAVLDFTIVNFLIQRFPSMTPDEAHYSKRSIVCNATLSHICLHRHFYKCFICDKNTCSDLLDSFTRVAHAYSSGKPNIVFPKELGDIIESIIGAVYMDSQSIQQCWAVINVLFRDILQHGLQSQGAPYQHNNSP